MNTRRREFLIASAAAAAPLALAQNPPAAGIGSPILPHLPCYTVTTPMMGGRLIAVSGVLRGNEYHLSEDVTEIGRSSSCSICIPDTSLSRRHCEIRQTPEGFELTDLESANGTLINSSAIRTRMLRNGDRISVGDSTFLFTIDSEGQPATVVVDDVSVSEIRSQTTVRAGLDGALQQDAARVNLERNLLTELVDASRDMLQARTAEALAGHLLKRVGTIIGADRGAILLLEDPSREPVATFRWSRQAEGTAIRISRNVFSRVTDDCAAVLAGTVGSQGVPATESLISDRVRSVAAAPLMHFGRSIGMLYLDSRSDVDFQEPQLQFVALVAAMAGPAFEGVQRLEWLRQERRARGQELIEHQMVGESAPMRQMFDRIARAAKSDAAVLIHGETGTGKELVALAIHANSNRTDQPFIALNCAAIPEGLLESELFGYERGAFAGAVSSRKGKLEEAHRGTLFLDEIGDMPLALQPKLLRALETGKVQRLGSNRDIVLNLRMVSATGRDLSSAVKEGRFRLDLLQRINTLRIHVPPLRERGADLVLLAHHSLARIHRDANSAHPVGFTAAAKKLLTQYPWPGNVRELMHAVESAVIFGSSEWIEPDDFPDEIRDYSRESTDNLDGYHAEVREAKRRIIKSALETAPTVKDAAQYLKLNPTYLFRLLRALDIRTPAVQ